MASRVSETEPIGDEQVVAHQLDLAAQLAGQLLPALPVLFIQAVLDGDDGVLLNQALPVSDQLAGGVLGAGLGQLVVALALGGVLPLGGSGVQSDHEVSAGLVASLLDSGQDGLDGLLIAGQVGSEAALITNGGGQALALQDGLQSMEDLSAHTQSLFEGGSADRHNHELLGIDGVGSVSAAVQNVHHGDGQTVAVHAAQEAVQGNAQRGSSSAADCDGHSQDRVGAQVGLVFGAVGREHRSVHSVDVGGVHADDGVSDDGIDILNGLGHALAQVTALVAVTQLQSLKLTSGSAARRAAACDGTVSQGHLSLNGGVATRVQNLATDDLFNFQIIHDRIPPDFSLSCAGPGAMPAPFWGGQGTTGTMPADCAPDYLYSTTPGPKVQE